MSILREIDSKVKKLIKEDLDFTEQRSEFEKRCHALEELGSEEMRKLARNARYMGVVLCEIYELEPYHYVPVIGNIQLDCASADVLA